MALYEVTMTHSAESLERLSRMQYDLFCRRNRIARTAVSLACVVFGMMRFSNWWGILLVAYGCYLITSTYSSANRTAHKIIQQIRDSGMDFPSSVYRFEKAGLHVFSLPEDELISSLPYSEAAKLGEDSDYYYIFRDQYGGYMISKEQLGDARSAFREFMVQKTGKFFESRRLSPLQKLLNARRRRFDEPYHL